MLTMDAIIVLGGGIRIDGTLTPVSKSRVTTAVILFKKGLAPRILMSGWRTFLSLAPTVKSEAMLLKEEAVAQGVPAECVFVEQESVDTITNAVFLFRRFLRPREWRSVAVVTSDFHVRRCKFIFQKVLGRGYAVRFFEAKRSLGFFEHARQLHHEAYALVIMNQFWDGLFCLANRVVKLTTMPMFELLEGAPRKGLRSLFANMQTLVLFFSGMLLVGLKLCVKILHGLTFAVYTIWPRFFMEMLSWLWAQASRVEKGALVLFDKVALVFQKRRLRPVKERLFAADGPVHQ